MNQPHNAVGVEEDKQWLGWQGVATASLECVRCHLIWVVAETEATAWNHCEECSGALVRLNKPTNGEAS